MLGIKEVAFIGKGAIILGTGGLLIQCQYGPFSIGFTEREFYSLLKLKRKKYKRDWRDHNRCPKCTGMTLQAVMARRNEFTMKIVGYHCTVCGWVLRRKYNWNPKNGPSYTYQSSTQDFTDAKCSVAVL